MNCFECEMVKTCKKCLRRITQIKYYSTDIIKSKILPENELGYMFPHYERELG